MRKVALILREIVRMVRRHKLYVLAPVLIALGLLSILVYYLGPKLVITLLYAGV